MSLLYFEAHGFCMDILFYVFSTNFEMTSMKSSQFPPKIVEEALCSVRFFITPRPDDYGARRAISTGSHVTHLGRHAPPLTLA